MSSQVHFSSPALDAVLKSAAVRAGVKRKADEIARNVQDQGIKVGAFSGGVGPIALPVRVTTETTDRAVAFVTLAHPAGIASQAKYGLLTRAAAASGLFVRGGD